jgi:hypothetical protein
VYEFHCEVMNIADDIELPYINCFADEGLECDSEHVSRHDKWWGMRMNMHEVSSPVWGYILF